MAKEKKQAAGSPNETLDLERFDYQNLNGADFEAYLELVHGLRSMDKYDFELWVAISDIEKEFDKKSGKIFDFVAGIKLQGNKPVQVTRLLVRDALELNKHVSHLNAPEVRLTSKYLLLVKPVKELVTA